MRAPTRVASPRAVCRHRVTGGGRSLLDWVRLSPLMDLTAGSHGVVVGLIDGPVAGDHPDFAKSSLRSRSGNPADCTVHDAVFTSTMPTNPALLAVHGSYLHEYLPCKAVGRGRYVYLTKGEGG